MKVLKNVDLEEVLFLDIETSTSVKELEIDSPLFDSWAYKKKADGLDNLQLVEAYTKEAALYADFGRVVCISVGRLFKGEFVTTTFNNLDEATLIRDFFESLDRTSKSIKKEGGSISLCGHAIKQFDIPYIFQRSIINGIIPHSLVDTSGEKPWTMDWILDTKDLWQSGGFNRSGLVNITTALGLPSPKEGITGAEVPAYFWADPEGNIEEISRYCERDVVAVYDVLNRFKNIEKKSDTTTPSVESNPIIQHLFDGGRYLVDHKKKLSAFIKSLSKTEQDKVFTVLDSIVSTASGKKTKFTKEHIKELKSLL